MRMNARYKVVSFLLTFIAASIAFIGVTRIFEYGYAADVVILVLVGFLFIEAWRITQIDTYLSMIESRMKQITKISIDGWETYLRSLGSVGARPTRLLTIALIVLVVPIYTIFNSVASFLSDFAYLPVNQSWLPYIKLAFFIMWEIPIMYCTRKALPTPRDWAKATSASDSDTSTIPKESKTLLRDAFFFFSGIIVSFILQLFYDAIREEPFYQNIMSMTYWRSVLAISCGIIWVLMVYYLKKRGLE